MRRQKAMANKDGWCVCVCVCVCVRERERERERGERERERERERELKESAESACFDDVNDEDDGQTDKNILVQKKFTSNHRTVFLFLLIRK